MYRIGGTQRTRLVRGGGVAGGIPPCAEASSHPAGARRGTVAGGQFDWGCRLLNSNGGAPWFPQHGWKPCRACKGIRELDGERDGASRAERRA